MAENNSKLRIGLLLDSYLIPAWAWEMLRVILEEDLARISFVLLNQTSKPSGSKSSFLYRTFSKIDRTFFKVNPNAFERKDIRSIRGFSAETISVKPIQSKYMDRFSEEDLEKVKKQEPDILIRLGFRILKGDILTIPSLGIWSYHHGDNLVNKGGPPCFWEVMLGWQETGSVLQILSEKLDEGKVIYRSWSRTDPLSVHRNANKVYWKSLFFIPRALERINRIGVDAWRIEVESKEKKYFSQDSALRKTPGNLQMTRLAANWVIRNLKRKLNESLHKEVWNCWLVDQSTGEKIKIENPPSSYLADPYLIEHLGQTWLFVEQYFYKSSRGVISYAKVENGIVDSFKTVLEESFHLSYPFIFKSEGYWWMITESSENRDLRFYHSKNFPNQWELSHVSFQGEAVYDPTLCEKDGFFWLFINKKVHPGSSSFDELFLYFSNNLKASDWISHPMNPIVSDVKSSRPAGKLFQKNGQWYRPAQDSAKHYGHRIRIQKITKWDREIYEEETDRIMEADWESGWEGTHTYNSTDSWTVMDTFKR